MVTGCSGTIRDSGGDPPLVIQLLLTFFVETAARVHHQPDASGSEHSRTDGRVIIPTTGANIIFAADEKFRHRCASS
jgi:hypothetical protein